MSAPGRQSVAGRLVLDDRVVSGRLELEGGLIVALEIDDAVDEEAPYIAPGFVDIHVHGWGGHDAMGGRAALDGMARALLRHGVTSFLPTAVSAPIEELAAFAAQVREWSAAAPADGAQPLGFNLEGPFLAPARRGAHDPALLRTPADVARRLLEPLVDKLRVITMAPELDGALELIAWLRERGVVISLGHSEATIAEARAGYGAGATSTTHLFNAMTGVDHRSPGMAVAALLDDEAYVELIADRIHVDRALWPLITRLKPADRLVLVSDAISLAGTGDGKGSVGGLAVEVTAGRVTLAGTSDAGRIGAVARCRRTKPGRGRRALGARRRRRFAQSARSARDDRPRPDRRRPARRPGRARSGGPARAPRDGRRGVAILSSGLAGQPLLDHRQ